MEDESAPPIWRPLLAIAAIAVLGWFAFVRGEQVPLLAAADLGFHELGHMLFAWAPEKLATLAGSGMQIGVPLGLATYFLAARHERTAGALLLGWAGTAAQNVSVYIGDAPYERLDLIGGYHDWSFLLRTMGPSALAASGTIASTVWTFGLLFLLGGVALCVAEALRGPLQARLDAAERARLASLPVHEPSTRPAVVRSATEDAGAGDAGPRGTEESGSLSPR